MLCCSHCYVSTPFAFCSPSFTTKSSQILRNAIFPTSRPLHMLHPLPRTLPLSSATCHFLWVSVLLFSRRNTPPTSADLFGCFPSYAFSSISPSTYCEDQLINFLSSQLDLKLERLCPTPNPSNSPQILKYT